MSARQLFGFEVPRDVRREASASLWKGDHYSGSVIIDGITATGTGPSRTHHHRGLIITRQSTIRYDGDPDYWHARQSERC